MAEYIDRQELYGIEKLLDTDVVRKSKTASWLMNQFLHDIKAIPAADVAPVVHGAWVDRPTGRYGEMQSWCTACGNHSGIGGIKKNRHKPYCTNCGAKMDGGKEND